ncbi:hypothetical protein SAMN02745248_02729 [Hathewaya proteolytica DSM 3090]|uniref:DUF1573 domain-containing protein n=1 Tax=Hathewaya proteolytica DSM 3090 TaxID=1121331 RepID=A0A1M6T5Y1_9CLOT|nr:DUF1573 domain-containing protein [Hathewaya proteolytica]SHK52148.1 hypothetical protein SAMN02745248_02729 [Hathewaya proteolytica DSM 3090]
MKDMILDKYQNQVNDCLIRHKSILDVLSKLTESEAKLNRAVCKSVTSCGCIEIKASKQIYNSNASDIDILTKTISNHLTGDLCPKCREVIENELCNNIFYLTCLCNLLDMNLYDVLIKESDKLSTLGKYTLR